MSCQPSCECGICRARQLTGPQRPDPRSDGEVRQLGYATEARQFIHDFEVEWLHTRTASLYIDRAVRPT